MREEGQDPGHPGWGELVHAWRERAGGWTALAEELVRRGGATAQMPDNLETIERGLRRLAQRGDRPGGQYGRWVERFFGVPPELASWLRWLGQYHSRFFDLPLSLRRRQLAHWDRPPFSEAAAGIWIDLGMASVGLRLGDSALRDTRLASARRRLERAPVAAVLEHALLSARIDDPGGRWLDEAQRHLDDPALEPVDALCYRARLLDGRAYARMRDGGTYEEGRALYAAIEEGSGVPFVSFRRAMGLSYCAWKLGDPGSGERLALEAADHAGDGGFVRLRAMALNLASRIAPAERAAAHAARAEAMSRRLEDEELLARVRKPR